MVIIELLKNIKWTFLNMMNKKYYSYDEHQMEHLLNEWFIKYFGKPIDFESPRTFNEKIQWLKLYDSTEEKAILADKYMVRDWVKEKIGEEYLIRLLGVYNSYNEIDFEGLPDRFVLKTNHASSTNVIVKDKAKINHLECKLKFKRWLSTNYALKMGWELHYGMIKPKIVCEKYMGASLNDYKLFCFNGNPEFFWVDVDRYSNHCRNVYDLKWNEMPFTIDKFERTAVNKPVNLEKMISLARILSKGFSFVRVDFYEIEGNLYFGEMTFTSTSGRDPFNPEEYDRIYGEKIILPEKKTLPMKMIGEVWNK